MSAFLAFANSRRAELKRQMPEASNGELSRTLSIMWKEAPEELRQSYIKEEKEKRETYLVAMADWKRKAEEGKQSVRQHEAQRTGESNLSSSYCDGAQDLTIPAFEHDNIEGNRYNRIGGSSSSLKMSSISHSRLSPYMLNNVSETYLQLGIEHQQPIPSLYGKSITKHRSGSTSAVLTLIHSKNLITSQALVGRDFKIILLGRVSFTNPSTQVKFRPVVDLQREHAKMNRL